MNFHDLSAQHIFFEINDTRFMNAYQNKNIFLVAHRNYCHKIKPQVYVHVFTSISVLQNSLSNITSLTALEILQLLLQLLFNSSHFCALLLTFHDLGCFPRLSRKSGHPGDWRSTPLEWRSITRDLDFGSGHAAYSRASIIDLYLHTEFHWNRKLSWTLDGLTAGTPRSSRSCDTKN